MDATELAARTGVELDRIEELVRLRILEPASEGGFDDASVSTARLAFAFETSGIALEDVAAAIERGELPEIGRLLLSAPVSLLPRSHREVAAELGLSEVFARTLLEGIGLPDVDVDAPVRDDDAELFALAAQALATGLPEESLLHTLRLFAEHLDRLAEHQRTVFRRDVQDRLLDAGMPRAQMLEVSAAIRGQLVELGFQASNLVHRRLLERQQFENTAEQLEILLQEVGIRRRVDADPPAVAFVDLSGFTGLTQTEGDEAAVAQGLRFAGLVRSATVRHGGRVVKLLGDGAMLQFERTPDAVRATAAIVKGTDRLGLPPARAGVATGPLIRRDGDFFGHTVNLAARICDAAGGGTVTAAREVEERASGFVWESLGEVALRGVPSPVDLVRLDPASVELEQV